MLNKRCLEIMDYLIKNNLSLSLKDMAEKFEISERSIRYDIENINYYLSRSNLNELEKSAKGTYILDEDISKVEKLLKEITRRFYVFSADERKEFIETRFLFYQDNKFLDFAEQLDVSISTIKLDLKEIKIFLLEHDLNLIFVSKQGVILQGNEEKIRNLQLRFMNKYLSITSNNLFSNKLKDKNSHAVDIIFDEIINVFSDLDLKTIRTFVKRIEKKLNATISDEAFMLIRFYIAIMIMRIREGNSLGQRETNRKFIMETKEFSIIEKEISHLKNEFEIEINESEILLLTEMFLGAHSYNFNSSFFENWIELETSVNEIIKDMGVALNINLSQDKILIDGLLNHLKPAYYRIRNNIEFENSIYDEVAELYESLYEKVESVCRKYLEKYIGKEIPKEEIAFLTIHFKTAIDRKLNAQKRTKNILLVCGLGYGSSKLLSQKLLERYDVNIVDTIPYHKFLEIENYDDIDLIITTLDKEEHINYPLPMIKVHPILTKDDRNRLESYGLSENKKKISLKSLLDIIEEETEIKNRDELVSKLKKILKHRYIDDLQTIKTYSLPDLLPLENIRVKENASSWEDAIRKAGQCLVDSGAVVSQYVDEMIQNVKINGSYMVINDMIALPHARTENLVSKTAMSLLELEEPVIFPGEKKVKIILCFSSVDHKEHIDALTKFVTLIEDYDFLNFIEYSSEEKIRNFIKNIS